MSAPAPLPGALAFLAQHRHGETARDLTVALREVVEAVETLEKNGSVTLKISVSRSGDMVSIATEVGSKIPRPTPFAHPYWAREGELFTADPYRVALPFPTANLVDEEG